MNLSLSNWLDSLVSKRKYYFCVLDTMVRSIILLDAFISTFLSKQFIKTSMTIWLIILFLKRSFVQCLETKGAYKMFRMEFPKHGCYTSSSYWFWTASTEWTTFCMIMGFTVWQSFVVEEWTTLEGLTTILKMKEKPIK